jgi:hypothetical protein
MLARKERKERPKEILNRSRRRSRRPDRGRAGGRERRRERWTIEQARAQVQGCLTFDPAEDGTGACRAPLARGGFSLGEDDIELAKSLFWVLDSTPDSGSNGLAMEALRAAGLNHFRQEFVWGCVIAEQQR